MAVLFVTYYSKVLSKNSMICRSDENMNVNTEFQEICNLNLCSSRLATRLENVILQVGIFIFQIRHLIEVELPVFPVEALHGDVLTIDDDHMVTTVSARMPDRLPVPRQVLCHLRAQLVYVLKNKISIFCRFVDFKNSTLSVYWEIFNSAR